MPEGINVELDGVGNARISFPDRTKRGPALSALIATGSPFEVRTGGKYKEYIVPEGNAREAGLIDDARADAIQSLAERLDIPAGSLAAVGADNPVDSADNSQVTAGDTSDNQVDNGTDNDPADASTPEEPVVVAEEPKKAAPAKKAPAKKAAPAAAPAKEDTNA